MHVVNLLFVQLRVTDEYRNPQPSELKPLSLPALPVLAFLASQLDHSQLHLSWSVAPPSGYSAVCEINCVCGNQLIIHSGQLAGR